MERNTKRIMCICLCSLLVVLNIKIARAEAVPDVMLGSATVADCVMSYYAMSGAAVANTDWINTLYNDLGSNFGTIYDFAENGMLTLNGDGTWQATTALETAIENAPAYQSLGLDQMFNVTAQEVAAGGGLAAASGGSILGGALGCTASTGVLPLFGGVTAAYWGGIALGTLIAHGIGLYGRAIWEGADITNSEYISTLPANTNSFGYQTTYFGYLNYIEGCQSYYCIIKDTNSLYLIVKSPDNNRKTIYTRTYNKDTQQASERANGYVSNISSNIGYRDYGTIQSGFYDIYNTLYSVANLSAFDDLIASLRSGTPLAKPKSPDLIGENGNLEGDYNSNNNQYTVPDYKPQIDPGTQAGVPLTQADWLAFANSVKNNNSNVNPTPDGNKGLFDDILNLIKTANPNYTPNPNPNPDPYTPPNPTPSPDPDYDPVPDNPNQPDYESEREGQTEPVPDSVPTGAPWITDGLLDKFPFCIPKDMIDMVKNFSSGTRQAPYISWRFNPPNTPVDYTFNLDLSDFEEIATLLRLLELGVFIVGLAFATRYLIGAT